MATKKSELVLTCNATAIKDVMNFLNQKLDELIRKRDQLNAKGVQNWTAQDKKNFKGTLLIILGLMNGKNFLIIII